MVSIANKKTPYSGISVIVFPFPAEGKEKLNSAWKKKSFCFTFLLVRIYIHITYLGNLCLLCQLCFLTVIQAMVVRATCEKQWNIWKRNKRYVLFTMLSLSVFSFLLFLVFLNHSPKWWGISKIKEMKDAPGDVHWAGIHGARGWKQLRESEK